MRYIITLLAAYLAFICPKAAADVTPMWSTGVAVPGEQVVLYLIDTDTQRNEFTLARRLSVDNASVGTPQYGSYMSSINGQISNAYVMAIPITPDRDGVIELGEIELRYQSGRKGNVAIPPLRVLPTSKIKWMSEPIPGGGLRLLRGNVLETVNYGCLWYVPEGETYVDQPVRAHLKLFLPMEPVRFVAPYAPQMQSLGARVSNFDHYGRQSALTALEQNLPIGQAYARGKTWLTMEFEGEFTPVREGTTEVAGKAAICVVRGQGEMEIPLETLNLKALPLPPGAPSNFANTVGSYSITAQSDAQHLAMHEPVEVEITVRGTGNILHLECPKPDDADSWKLMPSTRKPIMDASGKVVGIVFSQLMRPIAEVKGIPSFGFSYFDAERQEYRTAATAPIPLPWKATDIAGSGLVTQAAEPPPAGDVPVEEMADIYGFVPAGSFNFISLPRWTWLLLYLPALVLLGASAMRAIHRRYAAGAQHRARERQLQAVAAKTNDLDFLRSIGAFIESHIPGNKMTPELKNILTRRDEQAFRPDASSAAVSSNERNTMIKHVRKALSQMTCLVVMLGLILAPRLHAEQPQQTTPAPSQQEEKASAPREVAPEQATMQAAEAAYTSRQFSHAAHILTLIAEGNSSESASVDQALVYYNLGNCHYRLNDPGAAALCYARALQVDPGFAEAKANLAFVQRKQGAIMPLHRTADDVFTYLNTSQLYIATILCTAALALGVALLSTRKQNGTWIHFCTGLALMLSLVCVGDWIYYQTRETPDFIAAPPADLAYVVTDTEARSAADTESPVVVRIPASSPVHLLATRGSWSYVETAIGTRGWTKSAAISPLNPNGGHPKTPLSIRF